MPFGLAMYAGWPLQQIAILLLIATALQRLLSPIGLIGLCLFILVNYAYLCSSYHVSPYNDTQLKPDFPYGFQNNIVTHIDTIGLPGEKLFGNWDKYSLISVLAALPFVLCGGISAKWCSLSRNNAAYLGTLVAGLVCAGIGYTLSGWVPVNQYLWSPTYTLISVGILLGLLALLSLTTKSESILTGLGRNAILFVILLYMLQGMPITLLNNWIAETLFHESLQLKGAVLLALFEVATLLWIAWFLQWRKWYLSINQSLMQFFCFQKKSNESKGRSRALT
ncbi:MAG: hypothetical protein R3C11_27705 [Planctomycetaceae bacterium]